MNRFSKGLFIAAAAVLLCGCSDISERTPDFIRTEASVHIPADTGSPPESSDPAQETQPPQQTEQPIPVTVNLPSQYKGYSFTMADNRFLSDCVFIGDSVCKGLAFYEFVDMDRCFAAAGVAARNIGDFTFQLGGEDITFQELLLSINAKHIVFSMGINDLNMTTAEEFADNYTALLDMAAEIRPDLDFYVMAITPVTVDSTFAYNSSVNKYNAALSAALEGRENCRFADAGTELKSENGALNPYFSSDDIGVHLVPEAYYGILWTLCQSSF